MTNTYYFAYGSNMSERRMRERVGDFLDPRPAELHDYKLVFNKKSDAGNNTYANVKKYPESTTYGVLYQITERELNILDRYEGYPNHYNRVLKDVFLKDGSQVKAWVYIAREEKLYGAFPTSQYLDYLLEGKDFLPEYYVNSLLYLKENLEIKYPWIEEIFESETKMDRREHWGTCGLIVTNDKTYNVVSKDYISSDLVIYTNDKRFLRLVKEACDNGKLQYVDNALRKFKSFETFTADMLSSIYFEMNKERLPFLE
jgi:gamma-glutamylcyclotransferase